MLISLNCSLYKKTIILLFTSLLFFGCTSSQAVPPKIFDTIIIQNSTGVHIQRVTITEVNFQGKGKTGSLSPVPSASKQILTRGNKAQRLPDVIKVSWIDMKNKNYIKNISLQAFLSSSNKGSTMLLDLMKDGEVNVSVEKK